MIEEVKEAFGVLQRVLEGTGESSAEFMFMGGSSNARGEEILLFKHISTRRYLNVGHDGEFYRYVPMPVYKPGVPPVYEPVDRKWALRHVQG